MATFETWQCRRCGWKGVVVLPEIPEWFAGVDRAWRGHAVGSPACPHGGTALEVVPDREADTPVVVEGRDGA